MWAACAMQGIAELLVSCRNVHLVPILWGVPAMNLAATARGEVCATTRMVYVIASRGSWGLVVKKCPLQCRNLKIELQYFHDTFSGAGMCLTLFGKYTTL